MANAQKTSETKTSTMKVVSLDSAKLIEPYHTCSLEEGMLEAMVFPERSMNSVKRYVETLRPRLKVYRERDMETTFESPYYPVDDYFTVNGDGLLSVCIRVHDNKRRHEIATYDHTTKELKTLGYIPRHHFLEDVDSSVVCMNDPPYVEGVLGALSQDGQYFVVLAHSEGLRTLNVFDVINRACLFKMNCTHVNFLACHPSGIALNPKNVAHGHFNIAILNEDMEIRLWNPTTLAESGVKLENSSPGFYSSRHLINPRESAIRFSPDGRLLSVLAQHGDKSQCVCILLDAINLEPLYMLPYANMYPSLCSLFPCFTKGLCKVTLFACLDYNQVMYIDEYKLLFFEIPFMIETLKSLCKSSILNKVDNSKLNQLPLPLDLIEFLGDNNRVLQPTKSSSDDKKKQTCDMM